MKNLISFALVALLGIGVALAQNPHINKSDASDVVTSCGDEVCFSGLVSGLGNATSVDAYLRFHVEANTKCFNPAGGANENGVPGHYSGTIEGALKSFGVGNNGKAYIEICESASVPVNCPSSKWTSEIENLHITNVELVVNGKVVKNIGSFFSCP